jgi:hypothetical protein
MLRKFTVLLLGATSLVACGDPSSEVPQDGILSSQQQDLNVPNELKALRAATARYRSLVVAEADDFHLGIDNRVMGCVVHPEDPRIGAMGFHYGNQDRFDDPSIDELKPEVLVYYPTNPTDPSDDDRKLGAVEWVVPKAAWDAVHGTNAPPPVIHGHTFMILNPMLNWYVAHAWIWKDNPSGIMSDWNPDVICPPPRIP